MEGLVQLGLIFLLTCTLHAFPPEMDDGRAVDQAADGLPELGDRRGQERATFTPMGDVRGSLKKKGRAGHTSLIAGAAVLPKPPAVTNTPDGQQEVMRQKRQLQNNKKTKAKKGRPGGMSPLGSVRNPGG